MQIVFSGIIAGCAFLAEVLFLKQFLWYKEKGIVFGQNEKQRRLFIMKKRILALGLTSLMLLSGCGSNDANAEYLKDIQADKYASVGEYKGLEIRFSQELPTVSEEEVEECVNYFLENKATTVEVTDRAVQEGDITNIDYEGKMDGVAFEGGTAQGYNLTIGSGQFIPGFEEGMIGMELGETRDVEVTFPDPYTNNPDMSGKPAVFTVTVNSISALELPEYNDEFVVSLEAEGCTTVEEFEKYLEEAVLEQKQTEYDTAKEEVVLQALLAEMEIKKDVPEGVVNRVKDGLLKNISSYASMYGMNVPEYVVAVYGGTQENYDATLKDVSKETVEQYVALQVIADKENLNVSDEEFEQSLAEEATAYGYETAEEYKEVIDVEAYKEYLMMRKVLAFLADNAVVKEAE